MLNNLPVYAAFAAFISVIVLFVQAIAYDPRLLITLVVGVGAAKLLNLLHAPQIFSATAIALTLCVVVIWVANYLFRHFSNARIVHLSALAVLFGSIAILFWSEVNYIA